MAGQLASLKATPTGPAVGIGHKMRRVWIAPELPHLARAVREASIE